MQIVIYRNRGCVINNPLLFISKYPECLLMDQSEVFGMEVYSYTFHAINGKPAHIWANRWLKKASKTAKSYGTYVPIQDLKRETTFSANELKKSFRSCQGKKPGKTKCSQRKGLFNSSLF